VETTTAERANFLDVQNEFLDLHMTARSYLGRTTTS
jgi:hypothetical protein